MITMVLGGLWHGAAWTFVLWGGVPRRRAWSPSTRSTGGSAAGPRPGCAGPSPSTVVVLRLDPLPLAATSDVVLDLPRPAVRRPGAGDACGRSPVVLAVAVVIGLQLLPPRPLERLQLRIERLRAGRARASALAVADPDRRRDRARARACRPSSTSASEPMTEHRDDSEMSRFDRHGRAASAPATRSAPSPWWRCCWSCSPAARSATPAEQMDPGIERDHGATRSASRPAGSPTGCRFDEAQHEAHRRLSPDTELTGGRLRRDRAARRRRRPVAAGHRRTPSTPPRSATSRRRSRSSSTLLVTGDSLSTPLDTELARSSQTPYEAAILSGGSDL